MRPTVEDLQAIWLFTYSRASLLEAKEFLAELDKVMPESLQYRALIYAAIVAYARPFTICYLPPDPKKGRAAQRRSPAAAFSGVP